MIEIVPVDKSKRSKRIHNSNLTPTGMTMRNPGLEELRKVLNGDGRRLIVYNRDDDTEIIMPNEVRDILIDGKSIFIEEDTSIKSVYIK